MVTVGELVLENLELKTEMFDSRELNIAVHEGDPLHKFRRMPFIYLLANHGRALLCRVSGFVSHPHPVENPN